MIARLIARYEFFTAGWFPLIARCRRGSSTAQDVDWLTWTAALDVDRLNWTAALGRRRHRPMRQAGPWQVRAEQSKTHYGPNQIEKVDFNGLVVSAHAACIDAPFFFESVLTHLCLCGSSQKKKPMSVRLVFWPRGSQTCQQMFFILFEKIVFSILCSAVPAITHDGLVKFLMGLPLFLFISICLRSLLLN